MNPTKYGVIAASILVLHAPVVGRAKEDIVTTAVYAKTGTAYKREKNKDGSFKAEYYALSNGGRIDGTGSDLTVDRVTYPEVAEIAAGLLAQQNYRYAQTKEQAKLLLVLNWGSTLAPDGMHKQMNVAANQVAADTLKSMAQDLTGLLVSGGATGAQAEGEVKNTIDGLGPNIMAPGYKNEHAAVIAAVGAFENQMLRTMVDNRARDELNQRNSRVLGYMDELAEANNILQLTGLGDRYKDLITEVEESRYYIVVSAYDFPELLKTQKKKLLWQVRVSVRSPGNAFNDSVLAMLKSAAPYFGQNSGQLVRREETKGSVELGELKFLGEVRELKKKSPAKEKK